MMAWISLTNEVVETMAASYVDNQFQFAEMNIRYTGNMEKLLSLLRRAIRMGYDSIVVNTDVGDPENSPCDVVKIVFRLLEEGMEPPRKKKKKGKNINRENVIPNPVEIDKSLLNPATTEANGKKLSRLTVTVSDTTDMHLLMHHPQVRKYDILAIRTTGEQTLQTLSRKGDFVDIVTFHQNSSPVTWLTKSKLIQSCVTAGISFEISYAEALKDSSRRRSVTILNCVKPSTVLTTGRQLMAATRGGRGVIVDSGAEEMIDLRGPYDVANLSILFGISSENTRKLLSGNAKSVLLRAEARKTLKGALAVTEPDAIPSPSLNSKSCLERLMKVPEFRTQIEILAEKKDETAAL
ncbi:unnamed protein product [Enterobius vermicularis]|uniref:Ribonuclease P protein subunit p30 n=1 Tax=Enterobius vermicularis TaxID=51028 RepID=A0A0N4UYX2_ENTVE|nr:unnamed protein product [Enterobius vermicularis]